jgi:hypothetical protein
MIFICAFAFIVESSMLIKLVDYFRPMDREPDTPDTSSGRS